ASANVSPSSIATDAAAATDPCAVAPTGGAGGVNSPASASASGSCGTAAAPTGTADAATTGSDETPVADMAPAIAPAVTLPMHLGSRTRATQPSASTGGPPADASVSGGAGPATMPADATSAASAPGGGAAATTDPVVTDPTNAAGSAS